MDKFAAVRSGRTVKMATIHNLVRRGLVESVDDQGDFPGSRFQSSDGSYSILHEMEYFFKPWNNVLVDHVPVDRFSWGTFFYSVGFTFELDWIKCVIVTLPEPSLEDVGGADG